MVFVNHRARTDPGGPFFPGTVDENGFDKPAAVSERCRRMMKRPLAAILLACHLLVAALSVSPALHHWLHGDDAGAPDHSCLVTTAATGLMDAPEISPISVETSEPMIEPLAIAAPRQPWVADCERASGSRAPPLA
jgi:hypothetical protein